MGGYGIHIAGAVAVIARGHHHKGATQVSVSKIAVTKVVIAIRGTIDHKDGESPICLVSSPQIIVIVSDAGEIGESILAQSAHCVGNPILLVRIGTGDRFDAR